MIFVKNHKNPINTLKTVIIIWQKVLTVIITWHWF